MSIHYALHVFLPRVINPNPEFEPMSHGLDRMYIILNNTGQGDHFPEAELFFLTTNASCCAGFAITPFNKLPIALTIGILFIVIF